MNDITVLELHNKIIRKEDFILLDVREPHEYEEHNLQGKLIPLGSLPERLPELLKYLNTEIIVHCRSGVRSANAKDYLVSKGFTNVRNLLGGILAWNDKTNV